jgi:hypothetical protein
MSIFFFNEKFSHLFLVPSFQSLKSCTSLGDTNSPEP